MKQLNLSINKILEKEFSSQMRGFDKDEVNDMLDLIVEDYSNYNKTIQTLKLELTRLRNENEYLQTKVENENVVTPTASGVSQDILLRINKLEREVFGSKIND